MTAPGSSDPTNTGASVFAAWARCPDARIDIGAAAFAIARDEYPTLDVARYTARLDALAHAVRRARREGASDDLTLALLDRQLFDIEGFSGNESDYYDARNSYLNDVLDRRVGIPISLSVVYLEVGRRLGLDLVPISFPAHFLVRHVGGAVIDPFDRGQRLDRGALLERLVPVVGGERETAEELLPRALAPAARREVVARMLRNLKAIHAQAGDWPRALRVAGRLVELLPEDGSQRRDRGLVYAQLEAYRAAYDDLTRYLEIAPGAPDAVAVRERLEALRPVATRLN